MTGLYVPQHVIDAAKNYVGYHEGWNNYNTFSAWQYGDWHEPWCASFVSYCAYVAGFRWWGDCTYGERGDSNVGALHVHAREHGAWRETSQIAKPGWPVVLSFNEPDQHVEMVLSDQGGNVATIGGNTSDQVAYRIRYRQNIVGFVDLDDAGQTSPVAQPPVPLAKPPETNVRPTDRICARVPKHGGNIILQADGGVFVHGPAPFWGSVPGEKNHPVLIMDSNHAVSLALHFDSKGNCDGYWILLYDGSVHTFGRGMAYHGNFQKQVGPGKRPVELFLAGDPKVGYEMVRSDGTLCRPS